MRKNVTSIISGIVEVVFAIGEFVVYIATYLFLIAAILVCLRWIPGICA